MNVQITMTVDLDEIPAKSAELMEQRVVMATQHINHIRAAVINNLHNGKEPTPAMLKEIDNLRKTLFLLDSALSDSTNHLSGWIQNKVTPPSNRQLLTENEDRNEEG